MYEGVYNNTNVGNEFGYSYCIFKYTSNGIFISAIPIDINPQSNFIFRKNPINNNFYIAGKNFSSAISTFGGQTISGDMFLACYNETGQFLWVKSDTNKDAYGINDFFIDTTGNLYITGDNTNNESFLGYTITTAGYNASTVYKLDPNGNLIWGSNSSYQSASIETSNGITVSQNEVVVLPSFFNGITWGSMNIPFTPNNGSDAGILRLNKNTGAVLGYSIPQVTNGISESAKRVVSDSNGSFYVGGSFPGNYTINGTTLINDGGATDLFIAKYGSSNCNLASDENSITSQILVYPNPSHEKARITVNQKTSYVLYNLAGAKIQEGTIDELNNEISIASLPKGAYYFYLTNELGTTKTIKFMRD